MIIKINAKFLQWKRRNQEDIIDALPLQVQQGHSKEGAEKAVVFEGEL